MFWMKNKSKGLKRDKYRSRMCWSDYADSISVCLVGMFLLSASDFFLFLKVFNRLDQDQDRRCVVHDLGPNCLKRHTSSCGHTCQMLLFEWKEFLCHFRIIMSLVVIKAVFGVSDKGRLKSVSSATETS